MRLRIVSASLAAAMALANPISAATIVNGSFEQPGTFNSTFQPLTSGSNLPGWTIVGTIDLIRTYWTASDGLYSLDMSGSSAGTIFQVITGLNVGQIYRLSFDIAGNPAGGPTVKTLTAIAGGISETFTFDTTGKSFANMGWVTRSLDFAATAATAEIRFQSGTAGLFGPALDNVRIAALGSEPVPDPEVIPLPAAGWLLLGGIAGLVALRRKKAS